MNKMIRETNFRVNHYFNKNNLQNRICSEIKLIRDKQDDSLLILDACHLLQIPYFIEINNQLNEIDILFLLTKNEWMYVANGIPFNGRVMTGYSPFYPHVINLKDESSSDISDFQEAMDRYNNDSALAPFKNRDFLVRFELKDENEDIKFELDFIKDIKTIIQDSHVENFKLDENYIDQKIKEKENEETDPSSIINFEQINILIQWIINNAKNKPFITLDINYNDYLYSLKKKVD